MISPVVPKHIQGLIPKEIEKGIYYRLYQAKDGSISLRWWVKVWKNALPITQSAKSERYIDAVDLKRKLIAELENGQRSGGHVDRVRIKEVLEDYVSEARVTDRTRKEYRYGMEAHLIPALGKLKACHLDTDRLRHYRKERIAGIVAKKNPLGAGAVAAVTKSANTTVNRDFALLRAAMNHASRRTPPKVLRVPYFPMEREDNARQGFLEQEKYVKLRDSFRDAAVRLLFVVAYNIGCRSGELRKIEWSMVDLNDSVIRLPGRITKNKKPRTVQIFEGDMTDYFGAAKAHRDRYYLTRPGFSPAWDNPFAALWTNGAIVAAGAAARACCFTI